MSSLWSVSITCGIAPEFLMDLNHIMSNQSTCAGVNHTAQCSAKKYDTL